MFIFFFYQTTVKQPLAHSCFKRSQANRMGSCSSQPSEPLTTTEDRVEELTSQVVELRQQVEELTKRANFHEEEAGRAAKQLDKAVDEKHQAQGEVKVLETALRERQ